MNLVNVMFYMRWVGTRHFCYKKIAHELEY